jgi:16S rRNA processing protein RimM
VVRGEREYLIPAVEEFISETNPDGGYIKVKLIQGMGE